MGGEEITFRAEDQTLLEGMYFKNPNPTPEAKTLLICAGSHLSYENYVVPMVDALKKMGHNVMVFNYRGFGKSEGEPSEEGFNLDVESAYQFLKKKKQAEKIVVFGYSMGSAPATDLAAHHDDLSLVLDRYFSSMGSVAKDKGGNIAGAIFRMGHAEFDVKEKIKDVKGKIFLASGTFDQTMEPHHQQEIATSLKDNPQAHFVRAVTGHEHSTNQTLWFHPDNAANDTPRKQLENFLNQ